jgi:hypothetical protein
MVCGQDLRLGKALLLIIAGGEFPGGHVALATKAVTGIADQISRRGSAGVVVHSSKNPSVSFDGSSRDADAVGNGRLKARMN